MNRLEIAVSLLSMTRDAKGNATELRELDIINALKSANKILELANK